MDINETLGRFKKYGAFGQLLSFGFFCLIFGISYPVINDLTLLATIISVSAFIFFILYLYYIYWINHRIIKYIDKIIDKESLEILVRNLNQAANKTFYLQIIALSCVYIPVLLIMYFYLGYQNIYYHFYIIFISFFIILYAGYFTRNIWYTRTYPLGKLNIPVPVQRLRSKIVSLIIPTILLVNVIISVIAYLFYSNIIKSEVNEKVALILENETYILSGIDDYSDFKVSRFCGLKGGTAVITDLNGDILFSYPDKNDTGKNIIDIIEKNGMMDYLYNTTVESINSLRKNSISRFEGVYKSAHSVFISRAIGSSDKNLIYIFREDVLYDSVYISIFLFTLILFILNFFIWFAVTRKLRLVSQSMDAVMPAITAASRGDLTQPINIIKTRDVLEDFTRVCSVHFNGIREFMVMGKELAENLKTLSDHISDIGNYIGDSSIGHADVLQNSTSFIRQILNSLSEIAKNSEMQNTNIQHFEDTIEKLTSAMNDVSSTTNNVAGSMAKVNQSAEKGAGLVESTYEGILNIEKLYKGIFDVSRLISDIADRVNLLSLNASIEAARAGEHGKGFAVVAEEISKLADSTSSRAKEINDLINKGNLEVKKDKEMVVDMKQTFGGIMSDISESGDVIKGFIGMIRLRVDEIENIKKDITAISMYANSLSMAAQELNSNAVNVSDSIEIVNDGAQRFVERSERLTESSAQLSTMAQYLTQFLMKYKIQ